MLIVNLFNFSFTIQTPHINPTPPHPTPPPDGTRSSYSYYLNGPLSYKIRQYCTQSFFLCNNNSKRRFRKCLPEVN